MPVLITMLGHILANPFTSTMGTGALLSTVGPLLTMLGNGVPIATIIADPHFAGFLGGLAGLAAKDANK